MGIDMKDMIAAYDLRAGLVLVFPIDRHNGDTDTTEKVFLTVNVYPETGNVTAGYDLY